MKVSRRGEDVYRGSSSELYSGGLFVDGGGTMSVKMESHLLD